MSEQITVDPQVLNIEQACLGYLLSNAQMLEASQILTHDDFIDPIHSRIFAAMMDLDAIGTPPLMPAVALSLGNPVITPAGQPELRMNEYLARLVSNAAPGVTKLVKFMSDRRRMEALGKQLASDASIENYHTRRQPHEIATEFISQLDEIALSATPQSIRPVTIGAAARKAVTDAAERKAGRPERGVLSGLPALDDLIGPMEPGQGIVLAGRPSMGKTATALQIALNVAMNGGGVFIASLEMGDQQLAQRVLSNVTTRRGRSGVPYAFIARNSLSSSELDAVEQASTVLDNLPIVIEQRSGLAASQIIARARQVKREFEAKGIRLALIIVDHLGLVKASNRYSGNAVKEVGEISAAFHGAAKDLETPVLMLSQLSRKIEDRADKRPQLSDIRESGEVEQNADVVIGVYREAYYLERSAEADDQMKAMESANNLELIVLKQRQGPTGIARLWCDMACNVVGGHDDGQPSRPVLRAV